jgi:hypothetical protein
VAEPAPEYSGSIETHSGINRYCVRATVAQAARWRSGAFIVTLTGLVIISSGMISQPNRL